MLYYAPRGNWTLGAFMDIQTNEVIGSYRILPSGSAAACLQRDAVQERGHSASRFGIQHGVGGNGIVVKGTVAIACRSRNSYVAIEPVL